MWQTGLSPMSCSVAAARLERQAEPRYRTNVLPGRRSPCRMGSRGRLSTPVSLARHERRPVSCLAFQRSHVPDVDEDGLRGVQSGLCLAQAQRANAGVGVVDEPFGDGHRDGSDVACRRAPGAVRRALMREGGRLAGWAGPQWRSSPSPQAAQSIPGRAL